MLKNTSVDNYMKTVPKKIDLVIKTETLSYSLSSYYRPINCVFIDEMRSI